jgi:aryl-alcohol dehydrogenase-like predicted oxidoreductase
MRYRVLGRTGLRVSEIGFGTWAIGGPAKLGPMVTGWGAVDDSESVRAMETAFDAGVNFFDTADVYGDGHSEELIGEAFSGARRDRILIASKFGNQTTPEGQWIKDFSPKVARAALEASLKRLATDRIDLYQLHTPHPDFRIAQLEDTVDELERLKVAGKIRFYGTSIGPVTHGIELIDKGWGDVLQVRFSILENEPAEKLLPLAMKRKVGIIIRVPLASGYLTGKFTKGVQFPPDDHRSGMSQPQRDAMVEKVSRLSFLTEGKGRTMAQAALQYILSYEGVSTIIAGAKTASQAAENAAAAGATLTDEEMDRVDRIVAG